MFSLMTVWPLLRERFVANWRLLAVLGFGILVAASLLAVSPIYTRVMSDLGLREAVNRELRFATRSTLIKTELHLGTEAAAGESAHVAQIMTEELGWLAASEVRYAT